ncbi:MAG: hypothetical protein ABEJ94_01510 [Halorientalis sp.]
MSLLSELKGPVAGLAISALVFVAVGLYGVYDVLTAIPTAESLSGLVALVLLYAVVLLIVGIVGVAFLAWGAVRVAKSVDTDSKLFQNEYVRELGSLIGSEVGASDRRRREDG